MRPHTPRASERGAAILLAMMAMLLMTALGIGLMLTTTTETAIAGAYRTSEAARYAAEAVAERALADLAAAGDWNLLLAGASRSTFVDGAPGGSRVLSDGSTIALDEQVNIANCQQATACTAAAMNATTAERPWGANNPRWQLLAYAPLDRLVPGGNLGSPFYGIVLVADDPAETDGDPTRDGSDAGNPGSGIISIRAAAFGPRRAFRAIELTVSRPVLSQSADYNERAAPTGIQVRSWHEVR